MPAQGAISLEERRRLELQQQVASICLHRGLPWRNSRIQQTRPRTAARQVAVTSFAAEL
jgi:hypothetical protein